MAKKRKRKTKAELATKLWKEFEADLLTRGQLISRLRKLGWTLWAIRFQLDG